MLTLIENVPYDLIAVTDSVVKPTLSRFDKTRRVENTARNSKERVFLLKLV
jgi:hypothetical protein